MEWIGQGLGILAMIITALSYQLNTKRSLLFVQSVATLCTCFGYFFLEAWSGFALNLVCLLRNFIFFFMKEGTTPNRIAAWILAVVMAGAGALSWQGPISLLMIAALAANTVFLSFGKPQLLRKSILVTSPMIIVYNVVVFTVGGILNEAIAVVSSVIGIVRYKKQQP